MSEFYGWLQGNRGETTRGGSKSSGILAKIQSWYNSCAITLNRDEKNDEDILNISFGSKDGNKSLKVFINSIELSKEDLKLISENSDLLRETLKKLRIATELE